MMLEDSWNARTLDDVYMDDGGLMPFEDDGTDVDMPPARVGCMRFLGLRFATRVWICSPLGAALGSLPNTGALAWGDGGGVMRLFCWALGGSTAAMCE